MPSSIVFAYAYRSDYLARCLRCWLSAFARSLVDQDTLARASCFLSETIMARRFSRSVQCVPAIIGRREILVIEDANANRTHRVLEKAH